MKKTIVLLIIVWFSVQSYSQNNKLLSKQLVENFIKSQNNSNPRNVDELKKSKRKRKGSLAILNNNSSKVHNAFIYKVKNSKKRHFLKLNSLPKNNKLEKEQIMILKHALKQY
jgi:hypothetical protein